MSNKDPRVIGQADTFQAKVNGDYGTRIAILERTGGGGLTVVSGSANDPEAIHRSLFLAKGDILVATGPSTVTILPVGTDGQVLTADSSTATGLTWTDVGTVPGFPTYTVSNNVTDRTYDANATSLDEIADVLGTAILDLPLPFPSYTITNVTTDRTFNADATSIDEMADVLGTVIADLIAGGGPGGWNVTNENVDRMIDCNAVSLDEYADVLGTFINDLILATLLTA